MLAVVESAQHRPRMDGTNLRWRSSAADGGTRRRQCQAAVRALGVVVRHVLGEHGVQVTLVEDEHVVEAVVAQRAHHALRDRVGNL